MSTSSANSEKFVPYQCNFNKQNEWINTGTQDIMVFYPTLNEFSDFPKLIKKIENAGAHLASGICKIIPPKEWSPRPLKKPGDYSDIDNLLIYSPVKETIEGTSGSFTRSIKVYRKKMTVMEFRNLATSKEYANPKFDASIPELERHYWRSLLIGEPIYGADTPGSLYDANVKEFNMKNLGTILDLLKEQKIKIDGVNTIFLYFGMWKTTFPWHSEDMELYSINYLHYGEPKFWYAIPSQAAEKFERLACQQFPDGSMICKAFLRHKLYIISPTVLKNHSIPYGTMVQYPNEFIITFPKGYHMGFNLGYNCAESTNFALERWIDFGKNAVLCHCREDGVEIDMRPFMEKYRPEEFKVWHEYWYGERHSCIKDKENTSKKEITNKDPVLEAIYLERQKRLCHAKRTVKDLWCRSPVNFFVEKEFNIKRGRFFPHCAVCQYFLPRRILHSQKISKKRNSILPKSSKCYVNSQLFYKKQILLTNHCQIKTDILLECKNCHIVVHKNCYSVFDGIEETENGYNFQCVRCFKREDTAIRSISCELCELRGGALIEMVSEGKLQRFVHVICAIIHPKCCFLEPEKRRSVYQPPPKWLLPENLNKTKEDLNSDFTQNFNEPLSNFQLEKKPFCNTEPSTSQKNDEPAARYLCEVCQSLSHDMVQCAICLQTEENSAAASLRYHITCAPLADLTFERRDYMPFTITVCSFHNSSNVSKLDEREIKRGDRVIVRLNNENVINNVKNYDSKTELIDEETNKENNLQQTIVRKGIVLNCYDNLYCTVDFLDGTVSTDLFLSDIRKCDCHQFGCKNNHLSGALVYVLWHDNKIYEAYYRGKAPLRKYKVLLDSVIQSEQWFEIAENNVTPSTSKNYNLLNDKEIDERNVVEIDQDDIFMLNEPLPEEVRIFLLKRPLSDS